MAATSAASSSAKQPHPHQQVEGVQSLSYEMGTLGQPIANVSFYFDTADKAAACAAIINGTAELAAKIHSKLNPDDKGVNRVLSCWAKTNVAKPIATTSKLANAICTLLMKHYPSKKINAVPIYPVLT
ncbi:MAG TPA: hypothetical protein VLE89_05840 [Chlamydiales bacterium]|nr:hypothetical protein [Chlamydiales bacterium]